MVLPPHHLSSLLGGLIHNMSYISPSHIFNCFFSLCFSLCIFFWPIFRFPYPSSMYNLILNPPCRSLIRDTVFSSLEFTMILFCAFQLSGKILPSFQLFFSSFSFIFWKILIIAKFSAAHTNAWTIHGSVSIDGFFSLCFPPRLCSP